MKLIGQSGALQDQVLEVRLFREGSSAAVTAAAAAGQRALCESNEYLQTMILYSFSYRYML